jgi:hypothetical protein
MKNLFFIIIFFTCYIASSQDICLNDINKYRNAMQHIINDTITDVNIYFSDIVVDFDRFYFKHAVNSNDEYNKILDSIDKHIWFEDFSSSLLKQTFEDNNYMLKYNLKGNVVFFSTIEKNTLRADLFININRGQLSRLTFQSTMFFGEIVHSYLFFFDDKDKIKDIFRIKMLYD